MKIFNIKIDIQKLIWISSFLILLFIILFIIFNSTTIHMNNSNFTTILRNSHENISNYIGKKISTSGYVFRSDNFSNNQFVIARDMLINEKEANIVGFLCECDTAQDFEENEWVEATRCNNTWRLLRPNSYY